MRDYGAFTSLDIEEFLQKVEEGAAVIDIRREDEWSYYGIIEGSHTITFFDDEGGYDVEKFLAAFEEVVQDKEQPFILVCAHARRTKSVAEFLALRLGYKNVYELDGGINWGWIDKGYGTSSYKKAL